MECKGDSVTKRGVGFSTSKVLWPLLSPSLPSLSFPTSHWPPTGSPRRRGAWQSSGWKKMQESLMRSGMATTSRNGPCSLLDRKTMMDLFGGDSGWHLETGKCGGCVSRRSLMWGSILILFSCHSNQLWHWIEFQCIFPNPDGYDGVLSHYHLTSLCSSMGLCDHHRFRRGETLRQNRRACFPYYNPFHDWYRGVCYFPQCDEHRRSLCRLVSDPFFRRFSPDIRLDSWQHSHFPASLCSTHGSRRRYRDHLQSER